MCGPSVVIETAGVVTTEPLSTLYSTRATPEPGLASEPLTVVVKFVLRHGAVTAGVVLTGLVRSMRTLSERQADALPARSTIRVSSVWMPSVETAVGEPLWTVPLFTRHSAWSTPEAASVPVSASASVAVCQVVGAAALVLAGRHGVDA